MRVSSNGSASVRKSAYIAIESGNTHEHNPKVGTYVANTPSDLVKSEHLLLLAQGIADQTSGFFEKKGPGAGDHATGTFVRTLRQLAKEVFGADFSEKVVCNAAGFRFDFFFPDERTAVEFAFGLHNPNSEFERDILKCVLAIENGCEVKKLILVGKPGAIARLSAPAPKAIAAFVGRRFGLAVDVLELRVSTGQKK